MTTKIFLNGSNIVAEGQMLSKYNGNCRMERVKVFGGWIVNFGNILGGDGRMFIADPNHEWEENCSQNF